MSSRIREIRKKLQKSSEIDGEDVIRRAEATSWQLAELGFYSPIEPGRQRSYSS